MIKTPVRGMRDLLPQDIKLRDFLLKTIEGIAARSGFQKIETPAMEHLENLTSKIGGENEALIFKVLKRGRTLEQAIEQNAELSDSALRYDLTVPLARFYAEHSAEVPTPFKTLQIGSVWRADAPQKGRFRQFVQCDLDILGDKSVLAEVDVISTALDILTNIADQTGLKNLTLRLNDRRLLLAAAAYAGFPEDTRTSVLISLDKLDKIGPDGVRQELLSHDYDPAAVDKFLALFAEPSATPADFLAKMPGADVPAEVIENLDIIRVSVSGTPVVFDPTLVRGMGYYTGPIFECTADGLSSSIAGGGRYDDMIKKFSGADVPAIGFSIGFERLVTILTESGFTSESSANKVAFLVHSSVPSDRYAEVLAEAARLREDGALVSVLPMMRNLGHQISVLEQNGFSEFRKVYND